MMGEFGAYLWDGLVEGLFDGGQLVELVVTGLVFFGVCWGFVRLVERFGVRL